jgi:EAL domain-containing protein (putative c-di-GMP-specific phosphodiesterase class I)
VASNPFTTAFHVVKRFSRAADEWNIQDVRRAPPKLRVLAISLIGAIVFLCTGFLGLMLCVQQLQVDLNTHLKESDQALSQILIDIDRDLQNLPAGVNDGATCDIATQQDLTRMAINSVLVREFFLQSTGGEKACGSFGNVQASWRLATLIKSARSDEKIDLQIVPSESIRPTIVVARTFDGFSSIAIIEPRQLLDRLPNQRAGEMIALQTTAGLTLASRGNRESASSLIAPMDKPLAGWPLILRGSVAQEQLIAALKSQILFWFIASVLLTTLLVIGANQYWQRQSSKAVRLQHALKKRRFAPVVQPIVCTQTGLCVGAEVLMRWKHPVRGLVAPAEFIDYAERSGLIVPMSDLLMRQAHQQLADVATAYPALYFSFNVTPIQLGTDGFSQTLLDIFDGSPLGPERVVLELTERDLVDEQVRDELTRLRAKGFKIAIDDFGTGQSSLAVLQDLAIDKLKIDRAFVNTISSELNDQPVLDAIIGLAHRLNIPMVAEGIELPFQASYLRQKNVQSLQGYYFAKPMTALDFSTWVQTNASATGAGTNVQPITPNTPKRDLTQTLQDLQVARNELEKNRWNYARRHPNCILGNELVSWLAKHYDLPRKEALRLGKRLVARGYLVHVFEEHDLEDAPFFYRLLSMDAVNESRGGAMQINKSTAQLLAWIQGKQGVVPGKRYFRGLAFSEAVTGFELVEALIRAGGLDRQQAYAAAVQLMRQGLIKHSFDELGFIDSKAHHYHLSK